MKMWKNLTTFLVVVSLFFSTLGFCAEYYVTPQMGCDFINTVQRPGDIFYLERGKIYQGGINADVPNLYIGAYGTGNNPVIVGGIEYRPGLFNGISANADNLVVEDIDIRDISNDGLSWRSGKNHVARRMRISHINGNPASDAFTAHRDCTGVFEDITIEDSNRGITHVGPSQVIHNRVIITRCFRGIFASDGTHTFEDLIVTECDVGILGGKSGVWTFNDFKILDNIKNIWTPINNINCQATLIFKKGYIQ